MFGIESLLVFRGMV